MKQEIYFLSKRDLYKLLDGLDISILAYENKEDGTGAKEILIKLDEEVN
jgi:hypothetical protein